MAQTESKYIARVRAGNPSDTGPANFALLFPDLPSPSHALVECGNLLGELINDPTIPWSINILLELFLSKHKDSK